jgi:hypothetical protein
MILDGFKVLTEVREKIDRSTGGHPEYDDNVGERGWIEAIDRHITYAAQGKGLYRNTMLHVASLAIRAVETFDRKENKN